MPLDFPNSPSNGATYASGGITWQYDGEKWNILAGGGPTYETTLPSSPSDGREIYYAASATDSVIWHLRYRAAARSGSGAWEFIGGSSLYSEIYGQATRVGSAAFGDCNDAAGPTVALPANTTGDYTVQLGSGVHWDITTSFRSVGIAIQQVGGTVPTADAAYIFQNNTNLNGAVHLAREVRYTGLTGSWKLVYYTAANGLFQRRHLSMTPVRIWTT